MNTARNRSSALWSYAYDNASPDLARSIAKIADAVLDETLAPGRTPDPAEAAR